MPKPIDDSLEPLAILMDALYVMTEKCLAMATMLENMGFQGFQSMPDCRVCPHRQNSQPLPDPTSTVRPDLGRDMQRHTL